MLPDASECRTVESGVPGGVLRIWIGIRRAAADHQKLDEQVEPVAVDLAPIPVVLDVCGTFLGIAHRSPKTI